MQPIIYVDDQSVYDCRTHSLLRVFKFDVEILLGSMVKVIDKSEWANKLKTISLLIVTKFREQIEKLKDIVMKLGYQCENQQYEQQDVQKMLELILEAYELAKLKQGQKNVNYDSGETCNDDQEEQQQQAFVPENLQNELPIKEKTVLFNLVEKLQGFCIKFPWWGAIKQQIDQASNDQQVEDILKKIAPKLIQRWNAQKVTKEVLGKLCERILALVKYNDLDLELSDQMSVEALNENFREFIQIIYSILQLMMSPTKVDIEWGQGQAKVIVNDTTRIIRSTSEMDLKTLSYMCGILEMQFFRFKKIRTWTSFEVVESILEQHMPPEEQNVLQNLRKQIENNKLYRENQQLAQKMKNQVVTQPPPPKPTKSKKAQQAFQQKFDEYLKIQVEKNQQKAEMKPVKKTKLKASDEQSFKAEDSQSRYPKLGSQSEMLEYPMYQMPWSMQPPIQPNQLYQIIYQVIKDYEKEKANNGQ